jgi:predicted AAA+ superfamily ATPase
MIILNNNELKYRSNANIHTLIAISDYDDEYLSMPKISKRYYHDLIMDISRIPRQLIPKFHCRSLQNISDYKYNSPLSSYTTDKGYDNNEIDPEYDPIEYLNRKKRLMQTRMNKDNIKNMINVESIKAKAINESKRYLSRFILNRYGKDIFITNYNDIIEVNKFIEKYDTKYSKRRKNTRNILSDCIYIYKIDVDTYVYIKAGIGEINDEVAKIDCYIRSNNDVVTTCLYIYIFGKKSNFYYNKLIDSLLTSTDVQSKFIYKISGITEDNKYNNGFISTMATLDNRLMDSLYYKNNEKELVCKHIDKFFDNKKLYEERNILHKTGILLYGEPGTGKSSLCKAIASKYNLDMILIDMNTFENIDLYKLTDSINADQNTYLVLLEDIDTIYNMNRDKETTIEDRKIINKLLQFLDSNSSPSNVIFIATTNHPEILDNALLRDGRFDKKIEIKPLDEKHAIEMCNGFNCSKESIKYILSKFDDKDNINQSKMQTLILESIVKEINNAQ